MNLAIIKILILLFTFYNNIQAWDFYISQPKEAADNYT